MHTYTLTIQNSKRMLLDEKGNEKESDTDTAFTLTLCYTDPPSTPGAAHVLVNDLDLILQTSTTIAGVQSLEYSFGNSGSNANAKKDGSNTCEQIVLPQHKEMSVTIIVVAFRLMTPSQPYSLTASGLLRTKYKTWFEALNGKVREHLIAVTVPDLQAGWKALDVFNRGKDKGIELTDFKIIFPAASDAVLLDLMTEADDDKNRKFGFLEFSALMIDCKSGALRSKEPVYTEEKADAAFLASAENSKEAEKKTSNVQPTHGGSLLQQTILIAMLSIVLVQF